MEFRLLGLFEVDSGEAGVVPVGPGKESALLAVLLLHANEPVSVDRLVEELWGDERPANAAKTVQVYVSRLRKRLDADRLLTTAGGYLLRTGTGELDVERFEALARSGRQALESGSSERAVEALTAALELWRGPALADFRFEAFAQAEIRRLDELHGAVTTDRFDARLALGETQALLPELEPLARANPLDERLQGQLMVCLYRCGRQADALDVYGSARTALVDELGIEPGRRLRDLHQAILRQDPDLDVTAVSIQPPADVGRPFVGRERELAELEARLDAALAGHGSLVLLAGEPGIGKSRLAEELGMIARARGASVLVGRCWEAGGAPAYWPWVQSLRAHVRETEPSLLLAQLGGGAGEIAQILPELGEMFRDLPAPVPSESDGARFRLFDAISQFLRRAAESKPIVLGLDDLHAADTPSLLLLQFVTRELASARLLVLGAYRDVDPTPAGPLVSVLADLSREPVALRLPLHGLDSHAVGAYVEQTAAKLASPELTEAIARNTEGNPLFVGEMLRLLMREDAGGAPVSSTLAVPQSIRDVISRRLGHLPDACGRVLPAAAVLGREFSVDALALMSSLAEDELLEVLDDAIEARVVMDVPGTADRLRFAHVLIRDTLYDSLTATRRMRLHRQAVEALESLHGDAPGAYLAELAHHSLAGRELENGLAYARRAGDRAFALFAYEEAARLYETALEPLAAAHPDDDEARCGLLLSLGEARSRAGDSSGAKQSFLAAAAIAERTGLGRELARAAAGYGGRMIVARAGRDDRLVPLLERGLRALPDDEVELRARLLSRLAGALRDEASRSRRDALSREAVELARTSGNDVALAFALDGRAAAIIAPDTAEESLAVGAELCAVGELVGDSERVVQGCSYITMTHLMLGDLEAALAGFEAEGRWARELRQPAQLWGNLAEESMFAAAAGRFAEAERLAEQAAAHGELAIPELAIPAHAFQRYLLGDFRGALDEVEPMLRDVVADYPTRRVFACGLAHAYARQGRRAEAERVLDGLAANGFGAVHFDQEWLVAMSLLAETAALLGRADLAPGLYGSIAPYGALCAVDLPEGIRGSMSRYLGLLAALLERWDAAAEHYDEAIALNERMGASPWLALTRSDYARMLLSRDDAGDRGRAEELLAAASTAYAELGISGYP
jgi:DNA-binding SARP family transcriptional activator